MVWNKKTWIEMKEKCSICDREEEIGIFVITPSIVGTSFIGKTCNKCLEKMKKW